MSIAQLEKDKLFDAANLKRLKKDLPEVPTYC